jgi:hypothetical protein
LEISERRWMVGQGRQPASPFVIVRGFDIQRFQLSRPSPLGFDLVPAANQPEVIRAREQAAPEAAAGIRRDTEGFVAECVSACGNNRLTFPLTQPSKPVRPFD